VKRFDLIVRGGMVVLPHAVVRGDIGVRDGKIAELAAELDPDDAEAVADAQGCHVLPGMVDVHVHLNEPGNGHWEGFETGSAALAAGGCTTCLDMPLNGVPPAVTAEALRRKAAIARGRSAVDYGFWGGLMPGHVRDLPELADAGAVAFKAFMSDPGGRDEGRFTAVDDWTLYEGMARIAELGGLLALHAESDAITSALAARRRAEGRLSARDYAASRPPEAELEAVHRALFFAGRTGCRVHFVHISTAEALLMIDDAKRRGVDASAETCPHYLLLTADDMEAIGPAAKCAPPLRDDAERERMWRMVHGGYVDLIASDHSPCPAEWKAYGSGGDFFDVWGGIAGAQSSLELMISEGLRRGLALPGIAKLLADGPARRFGLAAKGRIAEGFDADLAVVDLNRSYVLEPEMLMQRHKHSPYIGRAIGCKVKETYVRGRLVYAEALGVTAPGFGERVGPSD
jgi:allantoinase